VVTLPRIDSKDRLLDAELNKKFTEVHPHILGALLDATSYAMAHESITNLRDMLRMATFAHWVCAAAPFFGWDQDKFSALTVTTGHSQLLRSLRVPAWPIQSWNWSIRWTTVGMERQRSYSPSSWNAQVRTMQHGNVCPKTRIDSAQNWEGLHRPFGRLVIRSSAAA